MYFVCTYLTAQWRLYDGPLFPLIYLWKFKTLREARKANTLVFKRDVKWMISTSQ